MESEQIYEILEKAYFSENCHEKAAITALPRLLEKSRTFLDLGASLGQYTRAANACMREGRITAVEADPVRFSRLRQNCEKWESAGTNKVTVIHAAVAERSAKEVEFQTTNSNVSGGLDRHSLDHLPPDVAQSLQWETIRIPAVSIDDICKDSPPDFVKMDIEGGEYLALKGATRTLARKTTVWLIEVHPFKMADGTRVPDVVRDLMWRSGYGEEAFFGKSLFRKRVPKDHISYAISRLKRVVKRLVRK